jgi:two-component system C4-dicarboxylate transport sensor histidine kinase DctB
MLVRHRTAQAEAEALHQRALADASALRAELVASQSALEQERLQRMLVHAGKLAAVGRLAAGVVHEMSHPVGTVALLAEALQAELAQRPSSPPAVADGLQTLVAESRRLQQFVTRLRHFARAEPLRIQTLDLSDVLADARSLFEPRLVVERVALQIDVPPVPVSVDPQRLALAVANLVFNAADALAGRPDPRVAVMGRLEARSEGQQVVLHVDDNGPGLSDAVQERLFEPFFTTRPDGLGLGLALSAESMAAMGGRLTAGRSASGGARFTIELPRAADDRLQADETPGSGHGP